MKTAQELNSLALRIRRMWQVDAYSPIDIFAMINGFKKSKFTLVSYPLSPRISGMCIKESRDIIICINSTMSLGRQRFTLAHELYHALFDNNLKSIICDMTFDEHKAVIEKEADQFASYLLMPYDALHEYFIQHEKWNLDTIIDAEQFYQISHQSMLNRLVLDGYLTNKDVEEYRNISISSAAVRLGYDRDLYISSHSNKRYFTTGVYIRKVKQLEELNLISEGKKEELLMEAYRADIVYNFDDEEYLLND